jgi:hypothetical protein
MIAEHLRAQARWRINRAEPGDDGRNAQSAVGLIDAATCIKDLDEGHYLIDRLARAGCFSLSRFNPGIEGDRIIRYWHYDGPEGGPLDLLAALVAAVEHGLVPRPRTALRGGIYS